MTHGCEHCGCGPARPSMTDTETTCHCGAAYEGSDHCPACGCEQYESLACFGIRYFDTRPRDGQGPYTHVVKRDSGYVAGYFRGEPPAEFVDECNANVPGDPARVEQIPPWPDETRPEIDARPQSPGNPYTAYTPESRVFEIALTHGQQAATEALAGAKPDVQGYRELLARIPVLRTRPSASDPKLRRDDLPGYSQADLMSHAGWVPHDGTDLRDELSEQYERHARTSFWNEVERRCLAALPHQQVSDRTQLGNQFITCACGTSCSGGAGDTIARQNFEHHLRQALKAGWR
jgi:hypothetical protein